MSIHPGETCGAGWRLALDCAVAPAIVPLEQVLEAGPVVMSYHGGRLEDDRSSGPLHFALPGQLLVRIGDRLLFRKAAAVAKHRATNAQIAGWVIPNGTGWPFGVHVIPAAVVVAAGTQREVLGKIESTADNGGAALVSHQQLRQPAILRYTIGVQKDDRIALGGGGSQVSCPRRISPIQTAVETQHLGAGVVSHRGRGIGRSIV